MPVTVAVTVGVPVEVEVGVAVEVNVAVEVSVVVEVDVVVTVGVIVTTRRTGPLGVARLEEILISPDAPEAIRMIPLLLMLSVGQS